nr:MAG TPA: hypothetical protein [Caudoviricetes sp.]
MKIHQTCAMISLLSKNIWRGAHSRRRFCNHFGG